MKVFNAIIFRVLSLMGKIIIWILSIILFLGFLVLISFAQAKLFLPQEYIMSVFKYPISNLEFIYLIYLIYIALGLIYISNKNSRKVRNTKKSFINNHKIAVLSTFVILNIVLIYTIFFDVTVITNNKIVDYTFLSPQGKDYSFNDIVKIDTGIYGKVSHFLPFQHYSRGDFYYIIQLNDGTKIDLADEGGSSVRINDDDDNTYDTRFMIEKLDTQYVNMGISKVSNMDNFQYCTQNLDKVYTQKIQNILLNVKR